MPISSPVSRPSKNPHTSHLERELVCGKRPRERADRRRSIQFPPLRRQDESRSSIGIIAKPVGAGARSPAARASCTRTAARRRSAWATRSLFPDSGVREGPEGVRAAKSPLKLTIAGMQALVSSLRTYLDGTRKRLSIAKLHLIGIEKQVINMRRHLSSSRTAVGDPRTFIIISWTHQKRRKSLLIGMHKRITRSLTSLTHVHAAIASMKSSLASPRRYFICAEKRLSVRRTLIPRMRTPLFDL